LDEQLVAPFRSELHAGGQGNAIVERIFAVGSKGETAVRPINDWLSEVDQHPDGVPEQMLCIADDFFGNVITLDLRAGSYGEVGLIDHELISESFDDPEGYQIVGSSFSEFIANLSDENGDQSSEARENEVEASSARWAGDSNAGLWVMFIGLAVALVALWWLGGF